MELALAPHAQRRRSDERWEHPLPRKNLCSQIDGYSLHAATTVRAEDRAGLERLCRYGLRASFALERLSLLPNGHVRYRLKRPWSDGRTDIVLSPLAFLRRLATLIPPKRVHTVCYHGVFSAASLLRPRVLPRFERPAGTPTCSARELPADASTTPYVGSITVANAISPPAAAVSIGALSTVAECAEDNEGVPLPLCGPSPDSAELLPIRSRRLDWATLLRRVYRVDVLECPRCQGRLQVIAAISTPSTVHRILDHLELPTTPPECHPARGPPEDLTLFDA